MMRALAIMCAAMSLTAGLRMYNSQPDSEHPKYAYVVMWVAPKFMPKGIKLNSKPMTKQEEEDLHQPTLTAKEKTLGQTMRNPRRKRFLFSTLTTPET